MTKRNSFHEPISAVPEMTDSIRFAASASLSKPIARHYPLKDVKILYGAAAARCAFPNCRKVLVLPGTPQGPAKQIGKIAHIVAHSNGGPRGDPTFPRAKLDTYENWILLCPTCHDTVDAQPELYTIDRLRELKEKHELWVAKTLSSTMMTISFADLEIALNAIESKMMNVDNSLVVISPDEKIEINHLSRRIKNLLTTGLMQAPLVQKVFVEMGKLSGGFEERIVNEFKKQYSRLHAASKSPDEIFYELLKFAALGKDDFLSQSSGLAILSHLFEKCDVFEKTANEVYDASPN